MNSNPSNYHDYSDPNTTAGGKINLDRYFTPETPRTLLSSKRVEAFEKGIEEAHREEVVFLDQILRLPFFEFCLQVKERKQRLEKELKQ